MGNLGKYTERIAAGLLKEGHYYKIVYRATGESGLVKIWKVSDGIGDKRKKFYTFEVIESRRYKKAKYTEIPVDFHFFDNNEFFLNPNEHLTETKKQVIHQDMLLDELERIELLGNIDRAIDSGDQELFMELTSQLKTHFVNN